MELEFHQLDLRYEALRRRSPQRERKLLAALSSFGQQVPVLVVPESSARFVLVDGYKRVRALKRLKHDTVRASAWDVSEVDALIMERLMRTAESDTPLEQGWLLCELGERFGLTLEELGRRFDKTPSWVSRRQGLVRDLPIEVQDQVRQGALPAHAAMKHLLPLARAKREDCIRLCAALSPLRPSSRQVAAIYAAWTHGNAATRARLIDNPELFLRAHDEAQHARAEMQSPSPGQPLLSDLNIAHDVARRASRRLTEGVAQKLLPSEREEAMGRLTRTQGAFEQLIMLARQELGHAG